jgi:hypothetical protein
MRKLLIAIVAAVIAATGVVVADATVTPTHAYACDPGVDC